MEINSYQEAVDYIESLPKFTRKHTLEHTREFLKRLGNPGESGKVIHVAGTNGKGSVCAYIQAILGTEEKRCGFFTSPHLIKINERIQIDRKPISDKMFFEVFREVRQTVTEMEKDGMEHPSYFEFLFGMGMLAFEMAGVEYIVLETGLGGRLDSTNALLHPLATVITSISLDHTDILGDTIEKIAFEKAGIIKEGVPVFFDGSNQKASEVIRAVAEKKHSFCREITKNAFEICEVSSSNIAFLRKNAYDKSMLWTVPFCGIYQVMNAEIALETLEYVLDGKTAHAEKWPATVASVNWEGRMEKVAPHFTVDGAHNPGAIEAFVQSVKELHQEISVLIFSAVSDKKYETMIEMICRQVKVKTYIVTEITDQRKVSCEELEKIFRKYTQEEVISCDTIQKAMDKACELRGDGEIYCIGSLYLVGAVKKQLAEGKPVC